MLNIVEQGSRGDWPELQEREMLPVLDPSPSNSLLSSPGVLEIHPIKCNLAKSLPSMEIRKDEVCGIKIIQSPSKRFVLCLENLAGIFSDWQNGCLSAG